MCVLCGSREEPIRHTAGRRFVSAIDGRTWRATGLRWRLDRTDGVIADAVIEAGGEVVGVIPDFLIRYEVGHRSLPISS